MAHEVHDMHRGWNSLAAAALDAYMLDGVGEAELAFYERRIRENGGLALDQACGTGRHIFPLLARGLEVHGADISADAIAFARLEAERRSVQPVLVVQSMEACDLPYRYSTIYVANGTFQILVDRHVALATLRRFREHLLPGGQVLLEMFLPLEASGMPAPFDADHPMVWDPVPLREAEGEVATTLWNESVDLAARTLVSKRRIDLIVGGKIVRSEVHAHHETWYEPEELDEILRGAGFESIRTYGDYTDQPVTPDSASSIYGARRPPGPSGESRP
jgi:ubiquinone/menaquinone biosynthesis C-methylase UbiE